MPIYRVFHLAPDVADDNAALMDALQATFGDAEPAIGRGLYREVAQVEADGPEKAFLLTNRGLDGDWSGQAGVLKAIPDIRSTSAGDLLLDVEAASLMLCLTRTWASVEPDLTAGFLDMLGGRIAVLDDAQDATPQVM